MKRITALFVVILLMPTLAFADYDNSLFGIPSPYDFLEYANRTEAGEFLGYTRQRGFRSTFYPYREWTTDYSYDYAITLANLCNGVYSTIDPTYLNMLDVSDFVYFSGEEVYPTKNVPYRMKYNASEMTKVNSNYEGFVAYSKMHDIDVITIVFRGSNNASMWITDFCLSNDNGYHHGALQSVQKFMETVLYRLTLNTRYGDESMSSLMLRAREGSARIVIAGHSLGGAQAQVLTAKLISDYSFPTDVITTYTFASFLPFTPGFISTLPSNINCYNIINRYDIVPRFGILCNAPITELGITVDDMDHFSKLFDDFGLNTVGSLICNILICAIIVYPHMFITGTVNSIAEFISAMQTDMLGGKFLEELFLFRETIPLLLNRFNLKINSALDQVELYSGTGSVIPFNPMQIFITIARHDELNDAQQAAYDAQTIVLMDSIDRSLHEIYPLLFEYGSDGMNIGSTILLQVSSSSMTEKSMIDYIGEMHDSGLYCKGIPTNQPGNTLLQIRNSNAANGNLVWLMEEGAVLYETRVTANDFMLKDDDSYEYVTDAPTYRLSADGLAKYDDINRTSDEFNYWHDFGLSLYADGIWFGTGKYDVNDLDWPYHDYIIADFETGNDRIIYTMADNEDIIALSYENGFLYITISRHFDDSMYYTQVITKRIDVSSGENVDINSIDFYGDLGNDECSFDFTSASVVENGYMYFLVQEGDILYDTYGDGGAYKYYSPKQKHDDYHMAFTIWRRNLNTGKIERITDACTNSSYFALLDGILYFTQPYKLCALNVEKRELTSVDLPSRCMNAKINLFEDGLFVRMHYWEEGGEFCDSFIVSYDMELQRNYTTDAFGKESDNLDYEGSQNTDGIIGSWRLDRERLSEEDRAFIKDTFGSENVYFSFFDDGSGSLYTNMEMGPSIRWSIDDEVFTLSAYGDIIDFLYKFDDGTLLLEPEVANDNGFGCLYFIRVD